MTMTRRTLLAAAAVAATVIALEAVGALAAALRRSCVPGRFPVRFNVHFSAAQARSRGPGAGANSETASGRACVSCVLSSNAPISSSR